MISARLESCYFGSGIWARMARVLAYSAAKHCSSWTVNVGPMTDSARGMKEVNTAKLDVWCERVQHAQDGTNLLLIDADTMILHPLDPVWSLPFDIAYTVRKNARWPMNAGAIFLRVSGRTKAFMSDWRTENVLMLHDRNYFARWHNRYGGMNQAAFGCLLETSTLPIQIVSLPCVEWNCEDSSWRDFDPDVTRIVHIKDTLRQALFENFGPRREHVPLIRIWRELEAEAMAHA